MNKNKVSQNTPVSCIGAHSINDTFCLTLCRLAFAGSLPRAPGTWGSLFALLFAPLFFLPLPFIGRVLVLIGIFFIGALAASRAEQLLQKQDPGEIVIDELLGMWLVFLPFAEVNLWLWLMGFVLFRIFDCCKPWPVNASEKWMRSGYGIMLDDVVAGCLAMLVLLFLQVLFC